MGQRPAGGDSDDSGIGGAAVHPAYEVVRPVTPTAGVLLADNPGKMTLEGTNTWLLGAPDSRERIVVDPGPRARGHIDRIVEAADVSLVLITHRHHDHTGGIARIARLTGAPVRALTPKFCRGAEPLQDGERIEAAGISLSVLTTPGHTADSISLVLDDAVVTGDTILGRGTAVIDGRDGTLVDYLASLDRLVEAGAEKRLLPGHGPDGPDTGQAARRYRDHRHERLDQVRAALDRLGPGASSLAVVRLVYADVDKRLWPAARQSVKAQLDYLRR